MNTVSADVIIHLNETPDDAGLDRLKRAVAGLTGVMKVRLNHTLKRFVLVDYNPALIKAQDILRGVEREGHRAVLVGM